MQSGLIRLIIRVVFSNDAMLSVSDKYDSLNELTQEITELMRWNILGVRQNAHKFIRQLAHTCFAQHKNNKIASVSWVHLSVYSNNLQQNITLKTLYNMATSEWQSAWLRPPPAPLVSWILPSSVPSHGPSSPAGNGWLSLVCHTVIQHQYKTYSLVSK